MWGAGGRSAPRTSRYGVTAVLRLGRPGFLVLAAGSGGRSCGTYPARGFFSPAFLFDVRSGPVVSSWSPGSGHLTAVVGTPARTGWASVRVRVRVRVAQSCLCLFKDTFCSKWFSYSTRVSGGISFEVGSSVVRPGRCCWTHQVKSPCPCSSCVRQSPQETRIRSERGFRCLLRARQDARALVQGARERSAVCVRYLRVNVLFLHSVLRFILIGMDP